MKSFGYAILLAALVGGSIFMCSLLSELAAQKCARNCPQDKGALVTKIDLGPWVYRDCICQ